MAGLTVKAVERASTGRHADGAGLYLLVSKTGAKSWVLRVQVHGRRRDIGLGSASQLSLAEAREKAAELRKVAKSGRDPIASRDRSKAAVPTFEQAANACLTDGPPARWSKRHASAFHASLKQHAMPRLGRLLVDSIQDGEVAAVLSPIWHEKPAAARKLRQQIRTVLDFAKLKGWRSTSAPQLNMGKQPRAGNFAMLPYAEVPEFAATLEARSLSFSRLAVLFVILTAARSGEVRAARWSQIDLNERTWTRPASVMKAGEAHMVTLSTAALSVLEKARKLQEDEKSDLIFPNSRGGPLSDMALLKLVKKEAGPFTVHGFRAAFRTWAAEQMPTVPEAVAEAALAHCVPDAVVRAYQRARFVELRRALLDAWGAFVSGRTNVLRLIAAS